MEFTWQDPPPAKRGGKNERWRTLSEELKEVPGKWALIVERGDHAITATARSALAHYGIEVVQRTVDGGYDIYARWPELET